MIVDKKVVLEAEGQKITLTAEKENSLGLVLKCQEFDGNYTILHLIKEDALTLGSQIIEFAKEL